MKGPRCQACRYQACLDAGMYHSGVQRTRGGRHGYSPMKQRSGSIEKYPTVSTPNISAVMAAATAAANDTNVSYEPAEVVSVSMSPSDLSEQADDQHSQVQHSFLQQSQIWEKFISDNARNELELLKSRTCIAETLLAEKTKQLDIVQKQVDMLKSHLLTADQLNKEQAITIESLKRRLQNGSATPSTNGKANGGSNGDKARVFENGGVTITPVVTTSSSSGPLSSAPSHLSTNGNVYSQNLLSHLLQKSSSNDMATIEPVHESSRGKS